MESEDHSTDSEEEAEKLKDEMYEAQKMFQEAGVIDEEVIYEKMNKQKEDVEDGKETEDPAPKGKYNFMELSVFQIH